LAFFSVVRVANRLSKATVQLAALEDDLLRMHGIDGIKRDEEESIVRILNVHDQTVWRNLPNRAKRLVPIRNENLVTYFDFLSHNSLLPNGIICAGSRRDLSARLTPLPLRPRSLRISCPLCLRSRMEVL
jgi:hypothetical protein